MLDENSKAIFGFSGYILLDDVEFCRIETSRDNLFEVLYLEEKIDLVNENFYEFETELLKIATRMIVFHDENLISMSNERSLISRRLANLLSACRLYLDQSIHHINNIYKTDSKVLDSIKKVMDIQYNTRVGYRVMQALRNYVQHRGFPIHGVKFSRTTVDRGEDFRLQHRVIPYIKISTLEEDKKFNKTIINELKETQEDDELDVRPLIRDYVEGIGYIHNTVRDLLKSDVKKWERVLDKTIKLYKKEFGKNTPLTGLTIVKNFNNKHWSENKILNRYFIERRQMLEKKNRQFGNLSKCFASNEIAQNDI